MYRKGHWGLSLLVFAPVGYALLRRGEVALALYGGAIMLALSTLPDVDHRIPGVSHRGATHTLSFALLVGAAVGALGFAIEPAPTVDESRLAVFGGLVGALGILAHLLGDVLTPMGVRPFWPLSRRSYTLRVTRADNALANNALFALGVFVACASVLLAVGV